MSNFIIEDAKKVFRGNNYLIQIIVVNVVLFVLQHIVLFVNTEAFVALHEYTGLSKSILETLFTPWTYISYMFMHDTRIMHVLSNMLWLYFLGRIFFDLYGAKRFLTLYILGGIFSGLFFQMVALAVPSIIAGGSLIGASGAVFAIVFGIATLQPSYRINLIFIGAVQLKYIALFMLILTSVLDLSMNTGGKIAHFGGALFGFVYAQLLQQGREISIKLPSFKKKNKSKLRVVHKNTNRKIDIDQMSKVEIQRKTDEILDKIFSSSYDALSKEEKEFLKKAGDEK